MEQKNELMSNANAEMKGITGLLTDQPRHDISVFQSTLTKDEMKGEFED